MAMPWDSTVSSVGNITSAFINAQAMKAVAEKNYDAQMETNKSNEVNVAATNKANSAQIEYANRMNRLIAQETNQANLDLWKQQDKSAWDKWKAQNAYDSPAAQAARLRQAGLNPNAILGQGSFSQAQAIGLPAVSPAVTGEGFKPAMNQAFQASSPHMDSVDYGQIGSAIMSSASQFYKLQMDKIDLKYKDMDWQKRLSYLQAQTDEALSRKDLTKSQVQGLIQQQKFLDASWNDLLDQNKFNALLTQQSVKVAEENALKLAADRAQTELQTQFLKQKIPLDLQQQRAMIRSIFADISLKQSQRNLTDKEVETEIAKCAKTWLEANGVSDANDRANELQPLIKRSYDNQFDQTQKQIEQMNYDMQPGFNRIVNFRVSDIRKVKKAVVNHYRNQFKKIEDRMKR